MPKVGKKPVTMGGGMPKIKVPVKEGIGSMMPVEPPLQRGGKFRPAGLLKKAPKIAERVPTGPMKGVKF